MNIPDPDKVVRLVVVVLPGFVILGLFSYATDLYFPEYAFTYIALSLSVCVYVVADAGLALMNRGCDAAEIPFGTKAYVLLVGLLIVVVTPSLLVLYESEVLLKPLGLVTGKVSQEWPLSYVLKRNQYRRDICGMDKRPFVAWLEPQCASLGTSVTPGDRPSYYAFARVFGKGFVYEGDIAYWQVKADEFQLGLVLACRVDTEAKPNRIDPVTGPIVTIFSKEVSRIEFIEQKQSMCWRYYYPEVTKSK
jgi:hypothetical protein